MSFVWISAIVIAMGIIKMIYDKFFTTSGDDEDYLDDSPVAEDAGETSPSEENEITIETVKNIVMDTLLCMQCATDWDEERLNLGFLYQEEYFNIRMREDSVFAMLYDTHWYSFPKDDIEKLARVKQIANEINWHSWATICYTLNDDGNYYVHIVAELPCIEEILLEEYLRFVLRDCFLIHRQFHEKIEEE